MQVIPHLEIAGWDFGEMTTVRRAIQCSASKRGSPSAAKLSPAKGPFGGGQPLVAQQRHQPPLDARQFALVGGADLGKVGGLDQGLGGDLGAPGVGGFDIGIGRLAKAQGVHQLPQAGGGSPRRLGTRQQRHFPAVGFGADPKLDDAVRVFFVGEVTSGQVFLAAMGKV